MALSPSERAMANARKHRNLDTTRCCDPCMIATLTIEHRDNLYRPLPDGIEVVVYDAEDNELPSYGVIKNGRSEHKNVRCGEIYWQLPRMQDGRSDGFVLYKAKLLQDANWQESADPPRQLIEPMMIAVRMDPGYHQLEAVYTPPPIMVNLRNPVTDAHEVPEGNATAAALQEIKAAQNNHTLDYDAVPTNPDLLSPYQIDQLQRNGGNVTIFIHGYNVGLGERGRFVDAQDTQTTELPWYVRGERCQRPWVFVDCDALYQEWYRNLKSQVDLLPVSQPYPSKKMILTKDADTCGTVSLSWAVFVEHILNINAAGETDTHARIKDWDKFTRIISISWSGNVHGMNSFFGSELEANLAARRLAPILMQLYDANIKINLISHSLGARVICGALNILADPQMPEKYRNAVNNVFMWEPAIADNALTNSLDKDVHPIKMDVFPYAHLACPSITVLHSRNDGVLGLDEFEIKDPIEAVTGWVLEGVYRKKVWDFAAEGPIPILDIYQNLLAKPLSNPYATTASNTIYTNSMPHPNNSENFKLLIKNMNAEIQSIRDNLAQTNLNATAGKDILSHAEFKFWQPWAHFFCIDETLQKDLCERLTNLFLDNWYYKGIDVVRPALGYYGFFNFTSKKAYNIVRVPFGLGSVRGGEVPGKNHDYLDDDFVYKKVTGSGEYAAVDQTTYYPNHSSMHDYYNVATGSADFQKIYTRSYRPVTDRILGKEGYTGTGFGKY